MTTYTAKRHGSHYVIVRYTEGDGGFWYLSGVSIRGALFCNMMRDALAFANRRSAERCVMHLSEET